jgi:nitronate monooxygenase
MSTAKTSLTMAGGPSSVDLVATASEAGALGSIGAAYFPANSIKEFTNKVKAKTKKPFAINLFIPGPTPIVTEAKLQMAIQSTQIFRRELDLPEPKLSLPYEEDFSEQFETVLSLKPKVFSFVFGSLSQDQLKEVRKNEIYIIGTATNLSEALELQESGVDAVVAQGFEAGGHRGIFDPCAKDPGISAFDLLSLLKPKISIPIIAAGGIMNAADIKKFLNSGADAVQMGTAFLATREAGTSPAFRQKLSESPTRRNTKLTRAFSGRLARGIVNRFIEEMDKDPKSILAFPAQNKFTRDIRSAAAAANVPDCLSLWSGSGEGQLWDGPAAELIQNLFVKN